MNIINAIREGRLYEAEEMIRKGLNRSMLSVVYANCKPVMQEVYGGPGAGVIAEDELEYAEECACDDEPKVESVNESMQLDEARDRAGWQAYLGRMQAQVAEKQHAIAAARTRVGDLRRRKAKPESIAKANEAITKKQQGLANLKKRIGEAQKKFQEWLKKEAEKAQKAREKARKKPAVKKAAKPVVR